MANVAFFYKSMPGDSYASAPSFQSTEEYDCRFHQGGGRPISELNWSSISNRLYLTVYTWIDLTKENITINGIDLTGANWSKTDWHYTRDGVEYKTYKWSVTIPKDKVFPFLTGGSDHSLQYKYTPPHNQDWLDGNPPWDVRPGPDPTYLSPQDWQGIRPFDSAQQAEFERVQAIRQEARQRYHDEQMAKIEDREGQLEVKEPEPLTVNCEFDYHPVENDRFVGEHSLDIQITPARADGKRRLRVLGAGELRQGLVLNGVGFSGEKFRRLRSGTMATPISDEDFGTIVAWEPEEFVEPEVAEPEPVVEPIEPRVAGYYSNRDVYSAIVGALGSHPVLFGNGFDDSAVAVVELDVLHEMLAEDEVSTRQYVADEGGANFDCFDYALLTKAHLLEEYGYNGILIIITPGEHAFCGAVIEGGGGPRVIIFEPQRDPATGAFSVNLNHDFYSPNEGEQYHVLL